LSAESVAAKFFRTTTQQQENSMNKKPSILQDISEGIPQDIRMIFEKPPLLQTEDPALYWRLFDHLVKAIRPANIVDWLQLKDIADYSWEVFRLQRFKGATVDLARRRAVESVLRTLLPHVATSSKVADEVTRLSHGWFTDPKTKGEAMAILKLFGLTPEVVDAEAFVASNQKLQGIDEMLGIAAVRRDASAREIERRREAVTYLCSDSKNVVEAKVVKQLSDTSKVA
jgi:hypothetical protein